MDLSDEIAKLLPPHLTATATMVEPYQVLRSIKLPGNSYCPTEYGWMGTKVIESWVLELGGQPATPDSDVVIIGVSVEDTSLVGVTAFWQGKVWGYSLIDYTSDEPLLFSHAWPLDLFRLTLEPVDWLIVNKLFGTWLQLARLI